MEAGMGGAGSVTTAFNAGSHLYSQGIDFDFMDFESLARARVQDKELRVAGERYRVLILPSMQAVRFSTMQKAAEFVRAGGIVIAIGDLPLASERAGRDDAELDALVREVFGITAKEATKELKCQRSATGGLGVSAQNREQVANRIKTSFPGDFDCSSNQAKGDKPCVMHRKIGQRDVFMVYGSSKGSECSFRATGRIELWDPWTGKSHSLRALAQTGESTRVRMPLTEKEAQLIVFSPGTAEIGPASDTLAPVASVVQLDGPWDFELKPTMDNRFGDFRWPPTPTILGAEARQFRYADETVANPGWENPAFDDSRWPEVAASFGPKFWKLGPLPDNTDTATLEAQIIRFKQVDPALSVEIGGQKYPWQSYSFSWRWGIENDPGHQGYHGLKEEVHDEFIGLGKFGTTGTGTGYKKEGAGSLYYLWSSVAAARSVQALAVVGGTNPTNAWLNHESLGRLPVPVGLNAGANPLLLRYDNPGRGFFVIETNETAKRTNNLGSMAMSWYNHAGVQPFDTRPQAAKPAGWYRFLSPPGLRSMTMIAHGKVQAWANGKPMKVSAGKKREDGSFEFKATASPTAPNPVTVALRIEQERGCYAGAALPEPIALDCTPGKIALGDWSQMGALKTYSGGAWYRKTITLKVESKRGCLALDLGDLAASAEVHINGKLAGIRVAPPWKFDITDYVKPGENRVEILVYSALGGHYSTIPTRYHGLRTSGLLGPVILAASPQRL
jgi:hypothetical protein